MEKTKNIYQKLLIIQQKIVGLGKDKDTKSQANPNGYKYVTGDKVLGEIKPLMNELGLILKQEVLSAENTRQDYNTKFGTKSEILTKLMMKFTWVDCDTGEKDENLFGANGQNDWEKGFGSALTYAERYFLLKYFHIATDEDDIDNPDRQTSAPVAIPVPPPVVHPDLVPSTAKWLTCVTGLADGKATIAKIKEKNTLSPEHEKQMLRESEIMKEENVKKENPTL